MKKNILLIIPIFALLFIFSACENKQVSLSKQKKEASKTKKQATQKKETPKIEFINDLTEKNSGERLLAYSKKNPENKAIIVTNFGQIEVQLFDDTPIHRANFIHLAKNKLFDNAVFYRVIKDFVIQGGNSDDANLQHKRSQLGNYTLPPELKTNHKHIKGALAMARGYKDNPQKRSAPFSFYIVHASSIKHLDGQHTVFGKVISGMEVVEKIAALETDQINWPIQDVIIKTVKVIE